MATIYKAVEKAQRARVNEEVKVDEVERKVAQLVEFEELTDVVAEVNEIASLIAEYAHNKHFVPNAY